MGHIYIDNSVHYQVGFIIGEIVHTVIDFDSDIGKIFNEAGFDSIYFEFKSSTNFTREPEKKLVREKLKELLLNEFSWVYNVYSLAKV